MNFLYMGKIQNFSRGKSVNLILCVRSDIRRLNRSQIHRQNRRFRERVPHSITFLERERKQLNFFYSPSRWFQINDDSLTQAQAQVAMETFQDPVQQSCSTDSCDEKDLRSRLPFPFIFESHDKFRQYFLEIALAIHLFQFKYCQNFTKRHDFIM